MKRKQYIIVVFNLVLSSLAFCGQTSDSLATLLNKKTSKEESIHVLLQLSNSLIQENSDSALRVAYRALDFSKELGLPEKIGRSQFQIAEILYGKELFAEAIQFYTNALQIFLEYSQEELVAEIYSGIAISNHYIGNYEEAIENQFLALKKFEELNNQLGIARSYHNIGIIYYNWDDADNAISYYSKALKIYEELNLVERIADLQQNIGNIFLDLEMYQQALEYYHGSWDTYRDLENQFGIAVAITNVGLVYERKKEYKTALKYYEQAITGFREIEHIRGEISVLFNIGAAYYEMRNISTARKYYRKSLALAQKHNLHANEMNALESLSYLEENNGNSAEALRLYKIFSGLKDSLFVADRTKQMNELESKYTLQAKEKEIQLLNKDNQLKELQLLRNDKLKYMMIAMLIILSSILILILWRFQAMRKLKKKYAKDQKENIRLEAELLKLTASQESREEELNRKYQKQIEVQHTEIIEHRKNEANLIEAKEKAEKADLMKYRFLSSLSHEIRTPMNGILGFSRLLGIDQLDNDKKSEYINIIQNNGRLLVSLLDNIIDIWQIEIGELKLNHTIFDVNDLMLSLHNVFLKRRTEMRKEGIELVMNINKMDRYVVNSDYQRLNQVLHHLLENAFKFTERGKIEFGYDIRDYEIQFYVKDTGIGIAKKDSERIFDNFVQLESNLSRSFSGNGLGLSLSKQLVKLMGSKIRVKSDMFVGSNFFFTLPLSDEVTNPYLNELGAKQKGMSESELFNFTGKKVLVAEDIEENFILLREMLRKTGAQVKWAKNGEEVLKIVQEESIDLLLLDIQMPQLDGYSVTVKLRKKELNLPIIAQTAYTLKHERNKCLEIGCNEYISKPIDELLLLTLMKKYLSEDSAV